MPTLKHVSISFMTTREQIIQTVTLPEDAGIEDAMEKLYFLAKIEKGIEQADAGETIPHEQVVARVSKWLE